MDFNATLEALRPELLNAVAVLAVAALTQFLRGQGLAITAENQQEMDVITKKGIQLTREEAARRQKIDPDDKMSGREKAEFAKDYVLAELNKRRSTILNFLIGWLLASFQKPKEAEVVTNIEANLEGMGEGATHG